MNRLDWVPARDEPDSRGGWEPRSGTRFFMWSKKVHRRAKDQTDVCFKAGWAKLRQFMPQQMP